MNPPDTPKAATQAAQALGWTDKATGSVVPPVHPGTTYVRDEANTLVSGRLYSRADNPGYDQVEALITALEGGAASAVFSSGMSAAAAIFFSLKPGDHALIPEVMYWSLRKWLLEGVSGWGVRVEAVDMTDPARVRKAMQRGKTRLLWIETPANPTMDVSDIAALSAIAHEHGALAAVDSTFATPILTRPLTLGADLVMHSATKYLNGHSDVVAGSVTTRATDEFWGRVRDARAQFGTVLGPFEAWLLLRGMRTLAVRVEAQCRSAQRIAERFERDPRVQAVLYPGLPAFPGHRLAAAQMKGGFGGMFSLRIKGGADAALACLARVRLWKRATSLGGVESLIEHRATVEGPSSPAPPDLLRLSTGLEAEEDLIADLDQALNAPRSR